MARLIARITGQGIVIESLWVLPSKPRLELLKQEGLQIPEPQNIRALIDTGATCSSIDGSVMEKLDLPTRGFIDLHTASSGNKPIKVRQFDVSFWLGTSQLDPLILAVPVTEADFRIQTIDCLVGMDVLRHCVLHVDGPRETAFLDFN